MRKIRIAVWFELMCAGLICANSLAAASKNLEIYWIDADGGASTLIVSPGGESMLVDSGNRTPDDRDAKRIFMAQQAGLKKIDILLTTHFHSDHMGGMAALAKLIPIEMYMDHGESIEIARPDAAAAYKAYDELSAGKRRILKAGDPNSAESRRYRCDYFGGCGDYQAFLSRGARRAESGVRRLQATWPRRRSR